MKQKMNKKGAGGTTLSINMIVAIFLAIIFIIFLTGGGATTIWDISKFLKGIPNFIWVILGFVILFKVIGGKRK